MHNCTKKRGDGNLCVQYLTGSFYSSTVGKDLLCNTLVPPPPPARELQPVHQNIQDADKLLPPATAMIWCGGDSRNSAHRAVKYPLADTQCECCQGADLPARQRYVPHVLRAQAATLRRTRDSDQSVMNRLASQGHSKRQNTMHARPWSASVCAILQPKSTSPKSWALHRAVMRVFFSQRRSSWAPWLSPSLGCGWHNAAAGGSDCWNKGEVRERFPAGKNGSKSRMQSSHSCSRAVAVHAGP